MQSFKFLTNNFMLIVKKNMGEQKKTGQSCIEEYEENLLSPRTSKIKYKAVREGHEGQGDRHCSFETTAKTLRKSFLQG